MHNYDGQSCLQTFYDFSVTNQKVEAALKLERQHCADLLAEQKKKASAQKVLTPPKKTPVSPQRKPRPRYDLNELRHHQRRCAALLFGARERGAHKLPVLVCRKVMTSNLEK